MWFIFSAFTEDWGCHKVCSSESIPRAIVNPGVSLAVKEGPLSLCKDFRSPNKEFFLLDGTYRNFPDCPVVKTGPCNVRGTSSIPG